MKTKNVRLRLEDIKQGLVLYKSHPIYGIEKHVVTGRPYASKFTGSLFVDSLSLYDDGKSFESSLSLIDAGIMPGEGYNHRRSFRKLKQAEEWQIKMRTDKQFIAAQKAHERRCDELHWQGE